MVGWKKWVAIVALSTGCIMTDGSSTTADGTGGPPLVVHNNSSDRICIINVSASTETNWGPDQMGRDEVLDPGQTKSWALPGAGTWDIRFANCQNETIHEYRNVEVGAGGIELSYP